MVHRQGFLKGTKKQMVGVPVPRVFFTAVQQDEFSRLSSYPEYFSLGL